MLADAYDCVVFDCDGVLWSGGETVARAKATLDARIAAAKDAVAGYAADERSWQAHISSDKEAMSSYGNEIVTLGRQMDAKYALVQNDVRGLIATLNGKLSDLSKQLKAAKDKDEARKAWSLFGFFKHHCSVTKNATWKIVRNLSLDWELFCFVRKVGNSDWSVHSTHPPHHTHSPLNMLPHHTDSHTHSTHQNVHTHAHTHIH